MGTARSKRGWLFGLVAVAAAGTTGCVGTVYAVKANSAASKLEEARTVDADQIAPFDYYYAEAHLHKAMEEAASADYGDAIELADTAAEHADKAIEQARTAGRGARP